MIRVRQVKVPIQDNDLKKYAATKLKIDQNDILDLKINKKSIDARKKDNIYYVYELDISLKDENKILKKHHQDILKTPNEKYVFNNFGNKILNQRPIIVGSGPAGLFCAYLLAENGYKPIIIERGEPVEKRIETVQEFWDKNILNENSNVQFGEGGAGTFSDGKLNTLVKEKSNRMKKVFETFVKMGAPEEILYDNKPHIGTDLLRKIVINIRKEIIRLGGEFKYNTKLTDIIIDNNKASEIVLENNVKIPMEVLVLAIGHSSRDTFQMLYDRGFDMEAKPFAVGIRVQHPQILINKVQYGDANLPQASYKLTYNTKERGIYSFCMCPGGYVVNASSEKEKLVINGMSNYNRNSGVANSAIVVTVSPNDFGFHPLDGIKFQREIEAKAYQIGNGKIPVQLYKDFKENKITKQLINNNYKFKGGYTLANINEIYPAYITDSIKEAMEYFGTKIKGFSDDNIILAAAESRTSSPVRILRDDWLESNIKGVYPCGEGAGYAGGITTSAIDGIKVAEEIMKKYAKKS